MNVTIGIKRAVAVTAMAAVPALAAIASAPQGVADTGAGHAAYVTAEQPYSPSGTERAAADDAEWAAILAGAPVADAIGSDAFDVGAIVGGASTGD